MTTRASLAIIACLFVGGFFVFTLGRAMGLTAIGEPQPHVDLTPLRLDLGTVIIGQPIHRTLILRNSGDARLLITKIKATCQCTIPVLSGRVLPPGASIPVEVIVAPTKAGAVHQYVEIGTNDPSRRILLVALQATAVAADQPH